LLVSSLALTADEIMKLLSRESVAVLATTRADGTPHAVPMWTTILGETIYIGTGERSAKARHLRDRPNCCLVVGLGPFGPSALLEGTAMEIDDEHVREQVYAAVAVRYYGSSAHPSYRNLARRRTEDGDGVIFRLDIDRVTSWDYAKMSESDSILP
jgi:PPOX class probable F420-dependent enzyme